MDLNSSDDDHHKGDDCCIRGMESVVATVSGYHGTERFMLIKLISSTGASYVGALAKSTTHLVCYEFGGKKYDLAKSFGTKVISHRWFEDCFKEGRRLPEDPYIMKCGKEVGPLLWRPQDEDGRNKKKLKAKGKSKMALFDCSNRLDISDSQEFSSLSTPRCRSNSYLPRESLEPGYRSSLTNFGQKRGTCHGCSSHLDRIPAPKSRRLVKKKNTSYPFSHAIIDCEKECYLLTESHDAPLPKSSSPERVNPIIRRTGASAQSPSPSVHRNDMEAHPTECYKNTNMIEKVGLVNGSTSPPTSIVLDTCVDRQIITPEANIQKSHPLIDSDLSAKEGAEKSTDFVDQKYMLTTELSCVICFTEFSSVRGVLPCGHRFCYACIKDWADRVIADRKVPTCPLCKATFPSITKLDDSDSYDQKIYSQTIPCSSEIKDISMVPERDNYHIATSFSDVACLECRLHEPEDLLTSCHVCNNIWVHSCCLDPPLVPWTCIHCRDLRMLYQLYR